MCGHTMRKLVGHEVGSPGRGWRRQVACARTVLSRSWLPRHVTWRAAASDFLPREATLAHLARSGIPPLAYHVVKMLL